MKLKLKIKWNKNVVIIPWNSKNKEAIFDIIKNPQNAIFWIEYPPDNFKTVNGTVRRKRIEMKLILLKDSESENCSLKGNQLNRIGMETKSQKPKKKGITSK